MLVKKILPKSYKVEANPKKDKERKFILLFPLNKATLHPFTSFEQFRRANDCWTNQKVLRDTNAQK